MLENSTGNKYLEENKETIVLKQLSNLQEFTDDILHEVQYEQMTLQL